MAEKVTKNEIAITRNVAEKVTKNEIPITRNMADKVTKNEIANTRGKDGRVVGWEGAAAGARPMNSHGRCWAGAVPII